MIPNYPGNVTDKILQLTLQTNRIFYLAIDDQGVVLNLGGEEPTMAEPDWEIGESILDQTLFLSGYIPMKSDYECIPAYQISDSCVIDIHLFKDEGIVWIIMVDKTIEKEWEAKARQSNNELKLLQNKLQAADRDLPGSSRDDSRSDFFESLDIMALRANEDDSFELLKPVSNRFRDIYPECFETFLSVYPQQKFAFLENFLVDAMQIWSDSANPRHLRSGPWIELSDRGEELALEAIALNWKQQKLLFIEILDESYQLNHSFLQIGREGALLKNILQEEVRKQTREIRAREEEIALRLVCAADSRDDGETGSHIRRLGIYSELMAKQLGWSDADAEEIRIAAPMHDIGKIGIPDHILKKPGKLTDSEFDIMKLHPEIGARILSNSSSRLVQMAREICLGHHEKWDGSGYPNGSKGEAIPLSARIVAIADVFDALVHKRVYKDGMSVDKAIEIMMQGRGNHFDPALLDLFISLKQQMSEIAFDYKNPIGEDTQEAQSIMDDIHLSRPLD